MLQEASTPVPAPPFEVNFGLFFWTWAVFLVLLWMLKKFAWPGSSVRWRSGRSVEAQLAETARHTKRPSGSWRRTSSRWPKPAARPSAAGRGQGRSGEGAGRGGGADQGGAGGAAGPGPAGHRRREGQGDRRPAARGGGPVARRGPKLIGERLDSDADRKLVTTTWIRWRSIEEPRSPGTTPRRCSQLAEKSGGPRSMRACSRRWPRPSHVARDRGGADVARVTKARKAELLAGAQDGAGSSCCSSRRWCAGAGSSTSRISRENTAPCWI